MSERSRFLARLKVLEKELIGLQYSLEDAQTVMGEKTYVFSMRHNAADLVPIFQGTLKTRKCKFYDECKTMCTYPSDFCTHHMHVVKALEIKVSTIPGAGMGLFARDDRRTHDTPNKKKTVFKRYDWITPYTGDRITEAELNRRYPGDIVAPYAVEHTDHKDVYIDAALDRCTASFANHKDGKGANAKLWNYSTAMQKKHHKKYGIPFTEENDSKGFGIVLQATRSIKDGDEIFANYHGTFDVHAKEIVQTIAV